MCICTPTRQKYPFAHVMDGPLALSTVLTDCCFHNSRSFLKVRKVQAYSYSSKRVQGFKKSSFM